MSLPESILVALFCMLVVFSVLAMLWGLIRVFSLIIRGIEGKDDSSTI